MSFVEIAEQVNDSLQLKLIRHSLLEEDELLHLLAVHPFNEFLDFCVGVCDAVGDDLVPLFV